MNRIKNKVMQLIMMKQPKAKINHEVALWLVKNYKFRSIIGSAKKDPMYVYIDGIFVDEGETLIWECCENVLSFGADNNSVSQIVQKVKRLTEFKREKLGCKNLDLICLRNCVLNLRTKETFAHSHKFGFMSKIPVDYDPGATCPKFEVFLDEVMYQDDIPTCQEWFGFLLYRNYFEKTSLVLIGPKDSGKTVLLNVMKEFVGEKNKSEVDLHDMITNRFATNGLFNKLLNINDELEGRDLKSTVIYKRLVGGSVIPAEAKNQTLYGFINHAKLVFATNQMPLPSKLDDPSSYFNKFTTFEFDNYFAKDDSSTDKFLVDKLIKPSELSGILNWAIEGFGRHMKNGKFSKSQEWRDVESVMKRTGRDIAQFEAQCCEQCNGNLVSKKEMYELYRTFCKLNDKNIEYDLSGFGRKFKPSYVVNKGQGPEKYRGWLNVRVRHEDLLKV